MNKTVDEYNMELGEASPDEYVALQASKVFLTLDGAFTLDELEKIIEIFREARNDNKHGNTDGVSDMGVSDMPDRIWAYTYEHECDYSPGGMETRHDWDYAPGDDSVVEYHRGWVYGDPTEGGTYLVMYESGRYDVDYWVDYLWDDWQWEFSKEVICHMKVVRPMEYE